MTVLPSHVARIFIFFYSIIIGNNWMTYPKYRQIDFKSVAFIETISA